MGRALKIARSVGKWAEAVEYQAKKMAQDGQVPAGFKLQTRRGNREITDATQAFQLSALDAETFMRCCKVSFKSLADAYKDKEQIPAKAAEKAMEEILAPVLQRKADTVSLVEQ
jgi:phosphoglycolate phosphatase-like HAD superfamily hydrolase